VQTALNLQTALMPRIHPASWWVLAIAIAVSAGLSSSLAVQSALIVLSLTLIWLFAKPTSKNLSLRFYLWMSLFVVTVRVAFRFIFADAGVSGSGAAAIVLPSLEIDLGFGQPISLFGTVELSSLLAGFTDGLRLSAIILAVGMANSLANPRRLLKATPAALFEVATTVAIAINLAPQLIESLQRVRRARNLRGRSKGIKAFAGIVVPVLEDSIERSLLLAASMDARGFGRAISQSASRQITARVISLVSVIAISVGAFVLLTSPANFALASASVFCGVLGIAYTVKMASSLNTRTQYKRQRLQPLDFLVFSSALVIVIAAAQLRGMMP
jgi:energy-coupling factor transport system permease protein